MMIVGLGNPGKKYVGTRHNVGFAVLDQLANDWSCSQWKKEFGVRWTRAKEHWLLEPQEFMNVSGACLLVFTQRKKLALQPASDLLVVHDDLDFPLGEIRWQHDRSAAGHNGVQSIIEVWGQHFSRLRVGIGSNRESNLPAEDYVLQPFTSAEQPIIDQAIIEATTLIQKNIAAQKTTPSN